MTGAERTITFLQPKMLTFGRGCLSDCVDYLARLPQPRIHIVTSPSFVGRIGEVAERLRGRGAVVTMDAALATEPTISAFDAALSRAKEAAPTCVLGLGGGSALDLAKLVAALMQSEQRVEETFGIGLLHGRSCHLVCVPTTAGTGSEVSPNAILLDEAANLKKGVVSPWLVPDATFIDPALTHTMPAAVTAATGLDALTHCIEAYTNKFAHPLVDLYALRGISLCAQHLRTAVHHGDNLAAREGMSLASLYGGLCLGPVNTAAVHALAYPLGGEFHVPHGLSNAVLLPAVFRFNAAATPERHAQVAAALGITPSADPLGDAFAGADRLAQLVAECGVRVDPAQYGFDRTAYPHMAAAAMTVTRLLKNNPCELTQADAERLYAEALG